MSIEVMKRKLPTFREWLEEKSPGTRAPDFEAFADLAGHTQTQALDHLTPDEASFSRMWAGASIAAVELCNMESARGRPPDQIVATMARAFACACMYSVASICREDAPYAAVARYLDKEFRTATKIVADTLLDEARRARGDRR